MSKTSRTKRKDRRAKERRGKKAANKARYAAMRDSGINSKSTRAKRNALAAEKVRTHRAPRVRARRMAEGKLAHLTWRQAYNQIDVEAFRRLAFGRR